VKELLSWAVVALLCGGLAFLCYCLHELRGVERDLRSRRPPPIPDAEIDYDYVTFSDLRRMTDEQLQRGYEHALRRERERREA
jgi:hypothetical protein